MWSPHQYEAWKVARMRREVANTVRAFIVVRAVMDGELVVTPGRRGFLIAQRIYNAVMEGPWRYRRPGRDWTVVNSWPELCWSRGCEAPGLSLRLRGWRNIFGDARKCLSALEGDRVFRGVGFVRSEAEAARLEQAAMAEAIAVAESERGSVGGRGDGSSDAEH